MSALSLAPRALYEEVAELLRQRIFARELEPGSWIDELRIAEALGISRTPLREALKVLAAEGLVTMKVRRGAYVTEVSEKDLRDVYHLLALLESDAARVVAARASAAQLAELIALAPDQRRRVLRLRGECLRGQACGKQPQRYPHELSAWVHHAFSPTGCMAITGWRCFLFWISGRQRCSSW